MKRTFIADELHQGKEMIFDLSPSCDIEIFAASAGEFTLSASSLETGVIHTLANSPVGITRARLEGFGKLILNGKHPISARVEIVHRNLGEAVDETPHVAVPLQMSPQMRLMLQMRGVVLGGTPLDGDLFGQSRYEVDDDDYLFEEDLALLKGRNSPPADEAAKEPEEAGGDPPEAG